MDTLLSFYYGIGLVVSTHIDFKRCHIEEEWERELEAELQDYEVVADSIGGGSAVRSDDDLLDEEPDLK